MTSLNPVLTIGRQITETIRPASSPWTDRAPTRGPMRCWIAVQIPEPVATDRANIRINSPAACANAS